MFLMFERSMEVKEEHISKQSSGMMDGPGDRAVVSVMLVRLTQPENADEERFWTWERSMEVIRVSRKAPSPIKVQEGGSSNEERPDSRKAKSLMVVRLDSPLMITEVRELQKVNAFDGITLSLGLM